MKVKTTLGPKSSTLSKPRPLNLIIISHQHITSKEHQFIRSTFSLFGFFIAAFPSRNEIITSPKVVLWLLLFYGVDETCAEYIQRKRRSMFFFGWYTQHFATISHGLVILLQLIHLERVATVE